MAAEIVGREDELAAIAEFLDHVAAGPAALVLEGEAGMGKTTLWRAGIERARGRRQIVLAAAPTEAEAKLAFAGLGDLLADRLDEVLPELPSPQRRALEVALLLRPVRGTPPDQRAVAVAFLGALRMLAQTSRVLVAVDDAQWLDSATTGIVQFAFRRLRNERVGLLLAARLGDARATWLAFDRIAQNRLTLGPLSLGAVHALLHARLETVLSRPALRRLHELAGGNPLYALELGMALERGTVRLETGEPLPRDLRELVSGRIAALPEDTRAALAVAAAASRPTLALVDAALPTLDAASALDPAVDGGVAELVGVELRFSHPLLASVAYALLSASRRREVHRLLAATVEDVEERARHLALGADRPDSDVARSLDDAASRAYARGAPDVAAELAEHAVRLTPVRLEDERTGRRIDCAQYAFEAGETVRARELLDEVVADATDGRRAEALSRLARLLMLNEDFGAAVARFEEALAGAGDDLALRTEIEEGLTWSLILSDEMERAADHAHSALELADELGDEASLAQALAATATVEFHLGRGLRRDLLERALTLESPVRRFRVLRHPTYAVASLLWRADDVDRARSMFQDLHRRAVERGDESASSLVLLQLSLVERTAGNWQLALDHIEEGYEAALQARQTPQRAFLLAARASLDALIGDEPAARADAEQALVLAEGRWIGAQRLALGALGLLELSLGDPGAAQRWLEPLVAPVRAGGVAEPSDFRFLPDAVEALVGLGKLEDAEALVDEYERSARAVQRQSALAASARCRGLLWAARGDLEASFDALEAALEIQRGLPDMFERARTLLALGAARRRAKQKRAARESFEAAKALFEQLGSRLWAEKARAELGRIGGRRAGTGLTPTERRVAELVAEGLSNKEVAAALFVTPKTVEANLSRIFAKLGAHSRTELARRLSDEHAAPKL